MQYTALCEDFGSFYALDGRAIGLRFISETQECLVELLGALQFTKNPVDLLYALSINLVHEHSRYGLAVLSSFKYIYCFKTPITGCLHAMTSGQDQAETMKSLYRALNSLDLEHRTVAPQVEIRLNK